MLQTALGNLFTTYQLLKTLAADSEISKNSTLARALRSM
jgi:hypothetical protein